MLRYTSLFSPESNINHKSERKSINFIIFTVAFLFFPSYYVRTDHLIIVVVMMIFLARLIMGRSFRPISLFILFFLLFPLIWVILVFGFSSYDLVSKLRIVAYFLYIPTAFALVLIVDPLSLISIRNLLFKILIISLPVNLIAIAGFFFLNINDLIHSLYPSYQNNIGLDNKSVSSSEGATSIFKQTHHLALFNIIILACHITHLKLCDKLSTFKVVTLSFIFLLSFFSGILTYTKFYYLAAAFLLLLYRFNYFLLACLLFTLLFLLANEKNIIDFRHILFLINVFYSLDFIQLFENRYGAYGYLSNDDLNFGDPRLWLFGLGERLFDYPFSDNIFRQLLIVGGLPLILIYLAPLILIAFKLFGSSYLLDFRPIATLFIIILVGGIVVDAFFFPRISIFLFIILFILFRGPSSNTTSDSSNYR